MMLHLDSRIRLSTGLVLVLAFGATGCPGGSTPPPANDAGPGTLDGGPRIDAPTAAEDAGPSPIDAGPSGLDAGPGAVDAGPSAMDAGPSAVDAGPTATDGAQPSGCAPACARGDYCDLCASVPACVMRPADEGRICPAIYMPVCGCDGMTYSNACALASAGIGLLATGECTTDPPPPPGDCADDRDCAVGEYCALCRGPGGGVMVCLPDGAVC